VVGRPHFAQSGEDGGALGAAAAAAVEGGVPQDGEDDWAAGGVSWTGGDDAGREDAAGDATGATWAGGVDTGGTYAGWAWGVGMGGAVYGGVAAVDWAWAGVSIHGEVGLGEGVVGGIADPDGGVDGGALTG